MPRASIYFSKEATVPPPKKVFASKYIPAKPQMPKTGRGGVRIRKTLCNLDTPTLIWWFFKIEKKKTIYYRFFSSSLSVVAMVVVLKTYHILWIKPLEALNAL